MTSNFGIGRLHSWERRKFEEEVKHRTLEIVRSHATFPERLRSLRQFSGLVQNDVRKTISGTQDRVSKLERNVLTPSKEECELLAELFSVPSELLHP
jgi:hypothetical protein